MFNRYDIGKYYQTNSLIHRLNPFYKIISLVLTIIMIILIDSPISYLLLGLYLVTVMAWSNIEIEIYLKNIYLIRILLIILFIFGIFNSIFMLIMLKIIYLVLLFAILTFTTPPMEITYGIEKLLRIFNKILPINIISLSLTLVLRFIPIVTSTNHLVKDSLILKGIGNDKDLKSKIKNKYLIFKRTLTLSFRKIKELKTMMDLRLYNYSYRRINYRLNKWQKIDTILLVLNIVMLILVIIY